MCLQENDLKVMVERFRGDQNILTAQMVSDLDHINEKKLKQIYNYNLNTLRNNLETADLVNEEFHFAKIEIDPVNKIIKR